MQRTVISKLISGLNASGGASASVSGGSGITVNNGVVSVDGSVVATDTELATQLANKANSSTVATNTASIATNASNIATNTSNITENTNLINTNAGNITGLSGGLATALAKGTTNETSIATLTPFQNIWRYDVRVLLGVSDDLMWDDNSSVWLDTATNTTGKLPAGIYTCKITTLAGYNNGGMGASENLHLWVFTGSFTHLKGAQGGAVNDSDDSPDIVEDVAQWWHKNEITSVAGARAFIVRKMVGSYMQTYFRFTDISASNSSYINLRFEMKRLW